MKVKLSGFRCYVEKEFDLPDDQIVNLSGVSGAGKSTLFAAIYWCLFGSLKNTQTIGKFRKTSVEIIINNLKIFRQARPNLLKVSYKGEYEGEPAQEIINKIFGTESVWLASSYLIQMTRNPLVCGKNEEKLEILSKLSFSEEPIDEYIDRIEKRISGLENSLKIENGIFERENFVLQTEIEKINWEKFVPENQREEFKTVCAEAKLQAEKTRLEIEKNNRNIGRKNGIEIQLSKLSNSETQKEKISELENKISELKKLLKIKNIPDLFNIKKELEELEEFSEIFTPEQLKKIKNDEFEYAKTEKVKNEIGLDIFSLENILKENPARKKAFELKNTKPLLLEKPETELSVLMEKLQRAIDSKKNLTCPHCKKGVRIQGPVLCAVENVENSVDLPNLQKQIENARYYNESQKRFSIWENEVNEFIKKHGTLELEPPVNEIQLISKLERMKSCVVFEKPVDSSFVEKCIRKNELENILKNTVMPDQELWLQAQKVTEHDLFKLESELKYFNKLENDHENGLKKKLELETELLGIIIETGLEEYFSALGNQVEEISTQIRSWEYMDNLISRREKLVGLGEKISKLENDLFVIKEIKSAAVQLECETLQNVVDNINFSLQKILENMFDDPISVVLNVEKKVKSTGRMKPGICLNILYKGGEYTNIAEISGGEGDRVSLAMTLALAEVSNSPILLLDETMAALNSDLREKCIETLKFLNQKTIICIDHETIDGYYDFTVEI